MTGKIKHNKKESGSTYKIAISTKFFPTTSPPFSNVVLPVNYSLNARFSKHLAPTSMNSTTTKSKVHNLKRKSPFWTYQTYQTPSMRSSTKPSNPLNKNPTIAFCSWNKTCARTDPTWRTTPSSWVKRKTSWRNFPLTKTTTVHCRDCTSLKNLLRSSLNCNKNTRNPKNP